MNIVDILEWHPNPNSPPPPSSSASGNWRHREGRGKKNLQVCASVRPPSTMSKSQKHYRVIHRLMVIKIQHQVIHDWWDLTLGSCHVNNQTNDSSLFDMQICTRLHNFIRLVADYITRRQQSHIQICSSIGVNIKGSMSGSLMHYTGVHDWWSRFYT
jgi:hypothetical protein